MGSQNLVKQPPGTWLGVRFSTCLGPWSLSVPQASVPAPTMIESGGWGREWGGAAGIVLLRWQGHSPCKPKTAETHRALGNWDGHPFPCLWLVSGLFPQTRQPASD